MFRLFAATADWLRDSLGERCIACEARPAPGGLCEGCRGDIRRLDPSCCPHCALPGPAGVPCGRCQSATPHYDGVAAGAVFGYPLDAMVRALKYSGDIAVARALASVLADRLPGEPEPDAVIAMPLSDARQASRGFNQSWEIARQLPLRWSSRLRPGLDRIEDTPAQAGLSLEERRRNVKNAFRASADLRGCRVAVVDDVMTSGATLDAAARALKEAGAAEVRGWIVARALRDG